MFPNPIVSFSAIITVAFLHAGCKEEKPPNEPPEAPAISIVPETPTALDNLEVMIETPSMDPEGDEVTYDYQWALNGDVQLDLNDTLVPVEMVTGGQVWSVTVTPHDGNSAGDSATALVTIANSAPDVTMSIQPDLPQTTDSLTLTYDASDIDGDEIATTLAWYRNGEPVSASGDDINFDLTERGQIWTASLSVDDGNGSVEIHEAQVEIQNTPPELLILEPVNLAKKDSMLWVSINAEDADSDPIFITYVWSVNGSIVQEGRQSLDVIDCGEGDCCDSEGTLLDECHHRLDPIHFSKDDLISLETIPSDDVDSGEPAFLEWTVGNSSPTIQAVDISPNSPLAGETIECLYQGYNDPDGDADLSEYSWVVDGVEISTEQTLNLGDIGLVHGDMIRCEVTPFDGIDIGSIVVAEATLANTPPVVSLVSMSPATPSKAGAVACQVDSASDADGETIIAYAYSWVVDGVDLGIDADVLGASYFNKGQSVYCGASAFDGTDYGPYGSSAPATVVNAPPSITSISVSPPFATSASVLTCSYSGFSDPDPNDIDQTITEWYSMGQLVQTGAVFDVTANGFGRGDLVSCKVTPFDGEDAGSPFFKNMPIGNAAPVISNVQLTPNPASTNDTLTVTADFVDLEGDTFTVNYKWYVDGIHYSTVTGNTLDGSMFFDKHQEVVVEIQADDQIGISTVSTPVLTISNTPPLAPEIGFDPYNPFPDQDLKCVVSSQIPDDDQDQLTYVVEWTKNGQPYTGPTVTDVVTNDTVEWTETTLNDVWSCSMTVSDDDGATAVVVSEISICPLGHYTICAPESCDDIIQAGYADLDRDGQNDDDLFYINPTGSEVIEGFCDMNANDGGWTLLLTADGNSTYWGNNSSNWTMIGEDIAPESLAEEDTHLTTYQDLMTNEIKICHTSTQFCYVFDHGLGISLYDFFANGITHVEYSFNNPTYADIGSSETLGNYETGLGYYYYTGTCRWVGINHIETSSAIGLLADDDTACAGALNPGHYDDIAFGIGMQSCDDGNGCALGGNNPAGQQRGLQPFSSPVLSPWMVFGR